MSTTTESRRAVVASSVGLHARPAALFTKAVLDAGLPVQVGRPGGPSVDAGSILLVMALGVHHGEIVEVSCPQPGSGPTLDSLVTLLETDHDID